MRIGFDGKRATQNFTGLGNYSRYLIRLLTKFYPENQYFVYATKVPTEAVKITGAQYEYPRKQVFKSFWRSFGIIKNLYTDQIDIFHGLSNEIPQKINKTHIKSVLTIHDLIFLRYPQYYPLFDRLIYKFKFRYAAIKADKIIAISQQTKQDIIKFFGVSEDKIQVIYQNCDHRFYDKVSDAKKSLVGRKYNLPESYLLNVGTIEERKNLLLAVRALQLVPEIHLVIIGRDTPYASKVKEFVESSGLSERVHFLNNVAFDELPAIYQSSKIFLYPSKFEGFGIPIVEALSSGVPVIAATGSCLEEAGGPGSIYINPDDSTALAAQITLLLSDPKKREQMISAGYEHLKKFADQKIAMELMTVYKNLLNNA